MSSMKALHLTRRNSSAPAVLSFQSLPKPTFKPGHLLVKVHASPIHPSDIINAKGAFPLTTFPRVPGRDFSGTIVEPAARVGEEVYGTSGFTQAFVEDGAQGEFILVPEKAVAPKPKNLSFVQAACIGVPFTTASLVLKRAHVEPAEVVLVLGADGVVGSAVVQLARIKKCRVLAATRSDSADINTVKDPKLSAVDALTQGKGVNVVVDTVGQPALTNAAILKMGTGGRLVFITAPRTGETDLALEMTDFYRKEKSITGCNSLLYSAEESAELMKSMAPCFENGDLKAAGEGEWTQVKLEDGVSAYEMAGKRAGKFVFVI